MNDDQLLRYSRHILLDEIGIEAQERILASRMLVVGAGGLGSPAALYLAAAGRPAGADGQLSVRYGFVGIEGVTRPWPMLESWNRLREGFSARPAHSSPATRAP